MAAMLDKIRNYDNVVKQLDDAKALIAVHENTIKSLEAKPAEFENAITEATNKISALETQLAEVKGQNEEFSKALNKAAEEKKSEVEKTRQSVEAIASAKAQQQLAEVGVQPVETSKTDAANQAPVMTRAEFDKMSDGAKQDFFRKGGKIKG